MSETKKHKIVIIGGGTAGLTAAAHILKKEPGEDVAIIEPSEKHYYQPLWTLVGGGVFPREETERNEADFIPYGAEWIKDAVTAFDPDHNTVELKSGGKVSYEFLVVAPGIQIDWGNIKGLKENLGRNGVSSNYSYDYVEDTWKNISSLSSGNAIFTQPRPPFKCAGAPQKIMYLADDHFRRTGVRDNINIILGSAAAGIFGVQYYAGELNKIVERKQIQTNYQHNLVEIRGDSKEAVFENLADGGEKVIQYDMIHVTPPQSAPDFIKNSPLADEAGYIAVGKHNLQHIKYENIFSLGDASSLPTSKTGAAVRKQAPILVTNLFHVMKGEKVEDLYDGYTSCPLVTGYGSLILAEFGYDGVPKPTFPFDQRKERYSMYALKAYALPRLYWHGMLRGRA